MPKARKYVVKRYFQGMPKREDYEVVEYELPALTAGEILVKSEYISVDPYLRAYNSEASVPYDQFSFQIGIVQESKESNFPVGTRVVSQKGWCDYYVEDPNAPISGPVPVKTFKLPDMEDLPVSHGLGAVGLIGMTAYFGFLEICKPKPGETVVVSSAAGGVGSLVGQIAKIKGCRVIGVTGSDDKVEWLKKDLGFDTALNYKKVNITEALRTAAPKGIDCYFDNVGGEISSLIIQQMNMFGRVSVCGSMSSYNVNSDRLPQATILQPSIVFKQLKIEGFLALKWADRMPEALSDLQKWVKSGQLTTREHITEGFDKLFDAFLGMLSGENFGKAIVKL